MQTDNALAIDRLVPAAKYRGVPGCTEAEYNALIWTDERTQPTYAELGPVFIQLAREDLKNRISNDYDNYVTNGIPVTVSWSNEPLVVLIQDVLLLSGTLAIASGDLASGVITLTDVVIDFYKFGDGTVKTNIQLDQLLELNKNYKNIRSLRYIHHYQVKESVMAGLLPNQVSYEACGLQLSDFDELELM